MIIGLCVFVFFFYPYVKCVDQCSRSVRWLATWLSILHGKNLNVGHCVQTFLPNVFKNLNVGHCVQTFLPNVFIPAMLIDTIDFYHFVPLSSDNLDRGSQGQRKAVAISYTFSHTVHMIRMKFDMLLKQIKLKSWCFFWVRCIEIRQTAAVLLGASKNFKVGIYLDVYHMNRFGPSLAWW